MGATVLALVVLGAVLYLIEALIPMPAAIKIVLRVVIVIWMVVLLLRVAGLL